MNWLIGCEFSGVVRDAFRARGHNAWSNDLLPGDSPFHLQGDVRRFMNSAPDGSPWDGFICFPDCTYLCSSGLHWNKRVAGRAELTEKALAFVRELIDLSKDIPRFGMENSRGCISTRVMPKTQTIQPYQYGHDASKTTDLWLRGLPPLVPDPVNYVQPRAVCRDCNQVGHDDVAKYMFAYGCPACGADIKRMAPRWANQTDSGQNKLAPSDDRWMLRAATYPGIARAFAAQWG